MAPAKRANNVRFSIVTRNWMTPLGSIYTQDGRETISYVVVKAIARQLSNQEKIPIRVDWIPDKPRRVTARQSAIIGVAINGSREDAMDIYEQFSEIASERGLS